MLYCERLLVGDINTHNFDVVLAGRQVLLPEVTTRVSIDGPNETLLSLICVRSSDRRLRSFRQRSIYELHLSAYCTAAIAQQNFHAGDVLARSYFYIPSFLVSILLDAFD